MRHPGLGIKKKLKDEIAFFPTLVKIHKGEKIEKTKKRKRVGEVDNPGT